MNKCEICRCNKICDHNLFGFEICDNFISEDVVEVKYGEWLEVDDGIDIGSGKHLECSICGKWKKDRIKSNYCPNCGANMRGDK